MKRFNVWDSVQPIADDHPRAGQAGTVHAIDPDKPDVVQVKWDLDGVIESVATESIRVLR